jgi:tripartite ATP-independent transporter DctM subunit
MKAMTENGYDKEFSAAITAASSTIGPVVPPSIAFVVYGSITGVSIVKLFMAGFIPGLLMGLALMIAVYFVAKKRGYPKDPTWSFGLIWKTFIESFLALLMPIIIIGGILGGIFTPTEAAVVASVYAFVIGCFVYKEIKLKDVPEIVWESIKQSVRVLFIIATAGFFGWLMIHQSIPEQVISGLTTVTGNKYVLLIIVVFVLLILGCFMEGIAVMVITIPIFMKVIDQFQIDPIQFGVIMVLCSMIGLLTPPVGMSLYAVATISNVSIGRLTRELFPYLLGIFIVTLIITYIPMVSLWLPNILTPE